MSTRGYLSGFSGLLRRWADRIDPENAPRATGWSFTIEPRIGLVIHQGNEGCPLWYLGDDDYERAHGVAQRRERSEPPKPFKIF